MPASNEFRGDPYHRVNDDSGEQQDRAEMEAISSGNNIRGLQRASDVARARSFEVGGIIAAEFPQDGRLPVEVARNRALQTQTTIQKAMRSSSPDLEDGNGTQSSDNDEAAVDILPEGMRLTLAFDRIDVWVPASFKQPTPLDRLKAAAGWKARKQDKGGQQQGEKEPAAMDKRQVLFGLSGKVPPGEVLALMGPSGSGKSTLLSVIGGRLPSLVRSSGTVTVNGERLTKAIRRHIGFVLQDDVLYESLTVWETLLYAALLRLPSGMPREEKLGRVEGVLAALGLSKTRNTIIGGFMRRGVSGGERKRVSIGHELLINPAVLMLDEPTSGLDSTTALHLLSLLRRLANEGRAILTTIHQPSSRLYKKLDRLMLLSEGHVMYYGDAHLVTDWFAHYGFQIEIGVNTADFIMDAATGEVSSGKLTGKHAIDSLTSMFERWYAQNPTGYHAGVGNAGMPCIVAGGECDSEGLPTGNAAPVGDGEEAGAKGGVGGDEVEEDKEGSGELQARRGASYLQQVQVLLSRALKVRRFEALSSTNIMQMASVALVCGMLWWQRGQGDDLAAANDIMGLLFFEVLFPCMRSLFSNLFTFPNEYRMLIKERPSGMYKLSAYYLARTCADLPVEVAMPFLFCTIIYWFGGLRRTAAAYVCNILSTQLLTFIAQSWGLLIGGLFMDPKTAQAVSTVITLGLLLVSGFYVRQIPVWIAWIRYISLFYWGYNLILKIEFRNRTFYDCGGFGATEPKPCTPVTNLKKALKMQVDPDATVWPEVVVMFGMLLLLRVVTYYVLRHKTRGRRV